MDDAARVQQLEAEVRQLREQRQADRAEIDTATQSLAAANAREAALAETLRIIAASPTNLQAVLDSLVASANRLCGADDAAVSRWIDGEMVIIASTNLEIVGRRTPAARTMAEQAIRERHTVRIHGSPEHQLAAYPDSVSAKTGYGATAITPLVRDGRPIGTLNVVRSCGRPVHRRADPPPGDVRGPGRHRDRERAAVPGASGEQLPDDGGPGAADGDGRGAAGDRLLTHRRRSGPRRRRPGSDAAERQRLRRSRAGRMATLSASSRSVARSPAQHRSAIPSSYAERRGATRAMLEGRTIHVPDTSDPLTRTEFPDSPEHRGDYQARMCR